MTLVNLGNNKVKVEKLGLKQGVSLMLIYLSMIELDVRRQIKASTNCIPKSNYNYKPNNYLAINCF